MPRIEKSLQDTFEYTKQIEPENWHHLCYSFVKNTILVILDGKSLIDDSTNLPNTEFSSDKLNDFVLGYRNNTVRKFLGEMAEVNIWSKGLNKVKRLNLLTIKLQALKPSQNKKGQKNF